MQKEKPKSSTRVDQNTSVHRMVATNYYFIINQRLQKCKRRIGKKKKKKHQMGISDRCGIIHGLDA